MLEYEIKVLDQFVSEEGSDDEKISWDAIKIYLLEKLQNTSSNSDKEQNKDE